MRRERLVLGGWISIFESMRIACVEPQRCFKVPLYMPPLETDQCLQRISSKRWSRGASSKVSRYIKLSLISTRGRARTVALLGKVRVGGDDAKLGALGLSGVICAPQQEKSQTLPALHFCHSSTTPFRSLSLGSCYFHLLAVPPPCVLASF